MVYASAYIRVYPVSSSYFAMTLMVLVCQTRVLILRASSQPAVFQQAFTPHYMQNIHAIRFMTIENAAGWFNNLAIPSTLKFGWQ